MASLIQVAILDDYQQVALQLTDWSAIADRLKIDVFTDTLDDEESLKKRLEPYEVICAMRERTKFPKSLLDKLPNLRLIATTGMKNAGIDVEYARQKGIYVSGTGSGGNSTLEHIWALILAVVRYIALEHTNMSKGSPQWQTVVPAGLAGKTLGLIGVGRLGSQTGEIAKAFNMRVIGWSPNLTPERATEAGVEYVGTKKELMEQSDIVSLHMVLSEKTRHLINAEDLLMMKPSAFFINTSRGPLVDEIALIEVLRNKKIAGAGLDVFDQEPLPLNHPLRSVENVTLSPHNGYVNDSNYKVFWNQTVENIKGYLEGKPQRLM